MNAIEWAEQGRLPDALIRKGIRRLLKKRLEQETRGGVEAQSETAERFIDAMRSSPVALSVEKANEQHYEVPDDLFTTMLGPRLKYSSCLWPTPDTTLAQAEETMLDLTCRRADLRDGMNILELGCGWGSLTLWMAERYPSASITAVSNSASQRAFILSRAAERKLDNVNVITCDMNAFEADAASFDRCVSVEMFEHMRNWEVLLRRVAGWLKPEGKLFVHIFVHRDLVYPFAIENETDWMAEYFFTGGMMPADWLMYRFPDALKVAAHWRVNGLHYARTLEAWLDRLDAAREPVLRLMADAYGASEAVRWFNRWRIFLLACAELFAFRGGNEWFVAHYRLEKPGCVADGEKMPNGSGR